MATADYTRATSLNLPKVDIIMLMEFMKSSDKHNIAEIRGVKALMSSRESYVESAVGYVEVKRIGGMCDVRAKVVPEHKISNINYVTMVHVNEKEGSIEDTTCEGCHAAAGGCKHTLVLLYWLQKRSSEPSPTSVQCYWVKPSLSSARYDCVESKDIFKSRKTPAAIGPKDPGVLYKFRAEAIARNCKKGLILAYDSNISSEQLTKYCVFDMMVQFVSEEHDHSYVNFKRYCDEKIENKKELVCEKTLGQVNSKLWHYMRQARITGSKIYEIAHCRTPQGSLVEEILGGYKFEETKAMKRGKVLEKKNIQKLEEEIKEKINEAGFYLIDGIFGASPDGLGQDFVVEVKCPISEKTKKNYINNNTISEKCNGQVQLEMLATGKNKCIFCVADPKFEQNGQFQKLIVKFDQMYVKDLMEKAEYFWKTNIYPKVLTSG